MKPNPNETFDANAVREPIQFPDFLHEPRNSVVREKLFNQKLFYDLKLAAAYRGYHLELYQPDVDRDGFDLMLSDGDGVFKIQIKTLFESKTQQWSIRKRLLRPTPEVNEWLGFESSPEGVGLQGGIVTITPITEKDGSLKGVEYRYTDVLVIFAICAGLVPGHSVDQEMANRVRSHLWHGSAREVFNLNKSFFVQALDAERLLALMGLHSRFSSSWRLNVLRHQSFEYQPRPPHPEDKEDGQARAGTEVTENLRQLIAIESIQLEDQTDALTSPNPA
jgi:hypothetical protein